MSERVIFHCDANSFFASVELLAYPLLKDKPVAVCGNPENRHGIILAKNEAAKRYKIQTAETVWQAKKKCPELILLPPHHNLYAQYSKKINEIYSRFSDRVEPFGIDESWLDVTGTWHLFGKSPREVADKIRETVKAETSLTISVGVSFNKVFSKLGSDYKKPDATTEFTRENFTRLVWALEPTAMLYVGKSAAATLQRLSIKNIGQLAAADPAELEAALGKQGLELSRFARGEENSPVALYGEKTEVKSIGKGLTFKRNLITNQDIKSGIAYLSDKVAAGLRRHSLFCNCVSVQIKDVNLKSISRQKQMNYPTHLASEIAKAAQELISENWSEGEPIRMLTITAQSLTDGESGQQISFLQEKKPSPKREALEKSLDKIRGKYGRHSISGAYTINNDIGLSGLCMGEEEEE